MFAAAASAFVRRSCLFGGAAACSSGDALSSLKSSRCWGWGRGRGYLSQTLPNPDHNPQNKLQKQKVPWLMLSSPTKPETRYLYDLLTLGAGGGQLQAQDGDEGMPLNCEIELPQIAGHHCAGSTQGFLITVDRNAEIHATNPITGDRLPLPSTATLPNMIGVVRDPDTGCIKRYVSSKNKLLKLQARPLFFEDRRRKDFRSIIELNLKPGVKLFGVDYMRFCCYGRVAISPGLDFAAVLPTWGSMNLVPAFARLGRQDTSWTALPAPNKSVHDITFCDGRLYTIDKCGTLAIFDLDNPSSPPFISPKGPLGTDALRRPRFLVASPDGDDLFLVERMIDFCCSDRFLKTTAFTVYMLDRSNFKWSRVTTSIADYALFVGFNDSVALSAREFPCLKPNTIYFTDYHYYSWQHPNYYKDVGVFNLEDGSIYPLNDNFNKFNWPPPIWFTRAMF